MSANARGRSRCGFGTARGALGAVGALAALGFALNACTEETPTDPGGSAAGGSASATGGSAGATGGSGDGTGGRAGGTGGSAGEMGDDECEIVSTTPVAWDAVTTIGAPATVFADVPGTCTAPFAWDGTGASLGIVPESGSDTLTATVSLDEASARWVEQRAASAFEPGLATCAPYLEIDAAVSLTLTDGAVVRDAATTVRATSTSVPVQIELDLGPSDVAEWITLMPPENTTVEFFTTFAPVGESCVGRVGLFTETVVGNTGSGMVMGEFASWSDSGCPLGQTAVDLTAPVNGVDVLAELANSFGAIETPALWDGGAATVLHLAVSTTATEACAARFDTHTELTAIPAEATLATDDSRLSDFATPGELLVFMTPDGAVRFSFGADAELACASTTDVLAYRAADCAEVASVAVRLDAHRYPSTPDLDTGVLEAYVTLRESSAPPGGSDSMEALRWGQMP